MPKTPRTAGEGGATAGDRVRLRDVAAASGVSVTTVSRILNGRETGVPVRQETHDRVVRTATEMGYRPNMLARGLRGTRNSLIGVIARDIADPFHIEIIKAINAAAMAREHRLFLGSADHSTEEAAAYVSMFERSHADGIILVGDIEGGEPAIDAIASQHKYLVGVTDRTSRRRFPGVYEDNTAATLLALDHLWGLGHRAIMCVSDVRTASGRLRIEVYERYMREHGVTDHIEVQVVVQGTFREAVLPFELGQRLFARPAGQFQHTAIFAASDTTAMGLMQAAYQAGIGMPADLSIVGIDDIDVSAYTIPPLTTINQSGERMGREAVEMLFEMIEQSLAWDEVQDRVIPPRLVVRGSTAPPAARAAAG